MLGLVVAVMVAVVVPARGEDTAVLLAEALRLKNGHRDTEALILLEGLLQREANQPTALLHVAHLHFRQGWLYGDKEQRQYRFFKADEAAQRAKALAPDDYAIRLMAVVAKGKVAAYLSSAEQVRVAWELREEVNALAAIARADDVDFLHLRSWLHFKVGRVSPVERLLAKIFFGGLPEDLDVDTAMALMRRAMELRPQSPIYPYDLGIFYLRLGQDDNARPWFEKVLTMTAVSPEDKIYQGWARQKLDRLNAGGG